jgi:hypothetical protein
MENLTQLIEKYSQHDTYGVLESLQRFHALYGDLEASCGLVLGPDGRVHPQGKIQLRILIPRGIKVERRDLAAAFGANCSIWTDPTPENSKFVPYVIEKHE